MEEGEAVLDLGEHGGSGGERLGEEGCGDFRFEGRSLFEAAGKGKGDGESVAQNGIVGLQGKGLTGDGHGIVGAGGGVRGRGEDPGDVVEDGRIGGGIARQLQKVGEGLDAESEVPHGGDGKEEIRRGGGIAGIERGNLASERKGALRLPGHGRNPPSDGEDEFRVSPGAESVGEDGV